MSNEPWFKFYPKGWFRYVPPLSMAERGAYISLLASMALAGKPLKNDVGELARMCGASKTAFKDALDKLLNEGMIHIIKEGLWIYGVKEAVFYEPTDVEQEAKGQEATI